MLQALRKRLERDEEGFTLIELMVVVLIIAILIAIAIPTFLGAQNRARDRAAQSDLRNALTAAKTLATDQEGYFVTASGATTVVIDATALKTAEAALDYANTFPVSPSTRVGVRTDDTTPTIGEWIMLARRSASGTTFGIRADQSGAVTYCRPTQADFDAANGTCAGAKW